MVHIKKKKKLLEREGKKSFLFVLLSYLIMSPGVEVPEVKVLLIVVTY